MAIDPDKALGAELGRADYTWTDDDVILYNLGVGAGNPPTDPSELKYAYEGDLRAVPAFGTIPPFGIMMSLGAVDGFDRPILHGLCTYGIVCKAVVEAALGGAPETVESYAARFTGHVFPGETLVTKVWEEEGRYLVETDTKERGTTVLSNAEVVTRSP